MVRPEIRKGRAIVPIRSREQPRLRSGSCKPCADHRCARWAAEARKELDLALQTAPKDIKALTALGMIQARSHDPSAIETFRKVVSLNPGSAEAHTNLGIALADGQRTEEALGEFSRATELDRNSGSAFYNKGRALTELHRYEEAIPILERACELQPQLADAFYRLGLAERGFGRTDRALRALRRAVALDGRNADAWFLLGQSLNTAGKNAEAVESWQKTIALDSGHSQALYSLARALAESDPERAAQYRIRFETSRKQSNVVERAQTLSNFALAAAREGKWSQAFDQLQQAIAVCGNCPSAAVLHKNLGLIQCQAGRLEEGEKELRTALAGLPADPEIAKALDVLEQIHKHK